MQKPSAPCKGCEDRRVTEDYNCHSVCDKYKEYLAENLRVVRQNNKENNTDAYIIRKMKGIRGI